MINEIEGVVVDIKDDKVIINVDGELKTYVNKIFKLNIGERVKFELRYLNELDRVVIYDKIID
jgi:hypothetical protein